MDFINSLFRMEFFWNKVLYYYYWFLLLLFLIFFLKFVRIRLFYFLERLSEKSETDLDDFIISIIDWISIWFYWILYLFIISKFINLNEYVVIWINFLFYLSLLWELVFILTKISEYILHKYMLDKQSKEKDETSYHMILMILKIFIFIMCWLFFLTNIWIEITPLLTSLWVAWVAVAFSLQKILADVFASFSLYFDKPFKIWDLIVLWDDIKNIWNIKRIWLRSTTIKTLRWDDMILPNDLLTSSKINNRKRIDKKRVYLFFSIEYWTSVEKLKLIKPLIKKIVNENDLTEYYRCDFVKFWEHWYDFEALYSVLSWDRDLFMDIQNNVNLLVVEDFEKHWINITIQTQKIILKNN